MLRRSFSAAALNEIANEPEIRLFLGGEGALDLSAALADPRNIALEAEGGGFVLLALDDAGTFELHTLFRPEARGARFFAHAREMFRYVFSQTPALEIVTKCPDDNAGARLAAGRVGFRERFRRENAWAEGVGISYRVFSVDDWFIRDEAALKAGREFHAALDAARDAAGKEHGHPEDEAHDRAVGAALLMAWGGQLLKGVAFYNRWAAFAGYGAIAPVGPGLVDIQDAIVAVQGGSVEILLLR